MGTTRSTEFVTLVKPVPSGHQSRVLPSMQVAGPDAAATCFKHVLGAASTSPAIVIRRARRLRSNHVLGAAPTSPHAGLYCHHHLWLASANSTFLQRARAAMPHRDTTTLLRRYNSDTTLRCDEDHDTRHSTWYYDSDTTPRCDEDSDTVHGVTKTSTQRVALRQRHSAQCYDSDTMPRHDKDSDMVPRHGEDNDTALQYGEDSNTVLRHGEYSDRAPWPLVYKSIVTVLVVYMS
ncbi:hypothetical protein EDB89DRAFT_1914425 [Lactarius sanguifluus]|nr:hypothetical protein EDB89DRAFT_1914425 [Lactarius sanguifluus]